MPTSPFTHLMAWPLPPNGIFEQRSGRWLCYGGSGRPSVLVDLESWPPRPITTRSEYIISFDVLPDGRLVVCSMRTDPPSEWVVRIQPPGWPESSLGGETPIALPTGMSTTGIWTMQDRIVACADLMMRFDDPASWRAYTPSGNKLLPIDGLPAVRDFDAGRLGHAIHNRGVIRRADGSDLLIWDGDGFEIDAAGRYHRTLTLRVEPGPLRLSSIGWGASGFFCLSNRRIMYSDGSSFFAAVYPDAENVTLLGPGPANSIVINHGKNQKRLVAQLWFPKEGEMIPIVAKQLGTTLQYVKGELHWSGATDSFYAKTATLVTFPTSDLMSCKRLRASALS